MVLEGLVDGKFDMKLQPRTTYDLTECWCCVKRIFESTPRPMYDLTDISETPILEMLDAMDDETSVVTRGWSRNASQKARKIKTCREHRAKESCPEVCWLCEEYDEERLPSTGVGCCFRAKEEPHDQHICRECQDEINQRKTL